ncbi:MAG: endonuclease domain-containing protein [Gammaproteobacteria bacterium]|nr:endonuclease domain-containing protein [Gammaproteobacteria bacterium]
MFLPYDRFVFTHRVLEGRTVRLGYRLEGGGQGLDLEEKLQLPLTTQQAQQAHDDVDAALIGLHLIGGISYWKTCCPMNIQIENAALSPWDATFWNEIYTQGLGEFYYRNKINPQGRVAFPQQGECSNRKFTPQQADGEALLLVGGGKDSAVSHQVLRQAKQAHQAFYVGNSQQIEPLIAGFQAPRLLVGRRLDPKLFELNAAGALNGHIPISAYYAFVAQLLAVLGGFGSIIASNERSASSANLHAGSLEVNHQWSKGGRFEDLFQQWQRRHLRRIPTYFSLLRPLSELHIARCFSRFSEHFTHFSSCNRNFRQRGRRPADRWCGHCSKCIFVFTMLSPWLEEQALEGIFGGNILADDKNLSILAQLLGLEGHKPFDCVGTPDEVAAALYLCHTQGRYHELPALRMFAERVLPSIADPDQLLETLLTPIDEHHIPDKWESLLREFLDKE